MDLAKLFPFLQEDTSWFDGSDAIDQSSEDAFFDAEDGMDQQQGPPGRPPIALTEANCGLPAATLALLKSKMFGMSLWVPGVIHIISNAQEEVLNSLSHFNSWLTEAQSFNNFFPRKWSRSIFVAECMMDKPEHEKKLVRGIHTKLLMHRWGQLVGFLRQCLSCAWVIEKYLGLAQDVGRCGPRRGCWHRQ